MVANDDGRTDRGNFLGNSKLKTWHKGSDTEKIAPVKKMVDPLKRDLTIPGKQKCSNIEQRKKPQVTEYKIYPEEEG